MKIGPSFDTHEFYQGLVEGGFDHAHADTLTRMLVRVFEHRNKEFVVQADLDLKFEKELSEHRVRVEYLFKFLIFLAGGVFTLCVREFMVK